MISRQCWQFNAAEDLTGLVAAPFTAGASLVLDVEGSEMIAAGEAADTTRVFWSGGDVAKNAAAEWAAGNGGVTLEMTDGGKILSQATKGMSWDEAGPMWDNLSSDFARGA